MAVEVSGEPRCMTSSLARLTFSRMEFMQWVSRRNTVSRPRSTNYDLDGFRKRPMFASIHEHIFMSSHADLGSPAMVASFKYQTLT